MPAGQGGAGLVSHEFIAKLGLVLLYRYWKSRQAGYVQMLVAATTLTYIGPLEVVEHMLFVMVIVFGFIVLRRPQFV